MERAPLPRWGAFNDIVGRQSWRGVRVGFQNSAQQDFGVRMRSAAKHLIGWADFAKSALIEDGHTI